MTSLEKTELTDLAVKVSDWFEIDLTIKLFGKTIFEYHFPPKKQEQ